MYIDLEKAAVQQGDHEHTEGFASEDLLLLKLPRV